MLTADGAQYVPGKKPGPVVTPGEFVFSAMHLDHGHIFGMCRALIDSGATLKYVYDPDPEKIAGFLRAFPQAKVAQSGDEVLADHDTRLIAAAAVTSERCAIGLRALDAGKDYFTDKGPFTTLEQLAQARAKTAATGGKYMVYFSERLHSESAVLAGYLVDQGAIGKVIQVTGFGPHRLTPGIRAPWFFQREKYGGILCDIGSHQIEQYLAYSGETAARVMLSRIGNYAHPQYPELDDFGDCAITGANGTTNYFRVDWFTPDGLRTWGDGRTLILGTEGYIELRKYINVAADVARGDHLFIVDGKGERYIDASGATGYPFFGQLILDCLERTETAMTQEHVFLAAELCLQAQKQAVTVTAPKTDL